MNIILDNVTDIEFDGINHKDYPKYCDAFISRAYYPLEQRDLTADELEYIESNYPEWFYEKLWEYLH